MRRHHIYMILSPLFWFPDWTPKIESRNVVFAHARDHVAHVATMIMIMSKTVIMTMIVRMLMIIIMTRITVMIMIMITIMTMVVII